MATPKVQTSWILSLWDGDSENADGSFLVPLAQVVLDRKLCRSGMATYTLPQSVFLSFRDNDTHTPRLSRKLFESLCLGHTVVRIDTCLFACSFSSAPLHVAGLRTLCFFWFTPTVWLKILSCNFGLITRICFFQSLIENSCPRIFILILFSFSNGIDISYWCCRSLSGS